MGIYYEKIIEYVIISRSGKVHIVVDGKTSDPRLAQSHYLDNRGGVGEWIRTIENREIEQNGIDSDFDIELSPEERSKVTDIIAHEQLPVTFVGWRIRTDQSDTY